MKILILGNVIPNQVASNIGETKRSGAGWFNAFVDSISKCDDTDLVICFYYKGEKRDFPLIVNGIVYYGFTKISTSPTKYDCTVEEQFSDIIKRESPDIVSIFGTEYPHTLAMVRAFHNPDKTIIHIQGLVSFYCRHYAEGVPYEMYNHYTLRDFLRQDNIRLQQKKFYQRGRYEIEAIENVGHVMGRTEWDEACCRQINPNIHYHYVQEIMHDIFYHARWSYSECEKRRIFMSQGSYPIKGLHFAIEALFILKKKWDDVKLYVAGPDIYDFSSFSKIIRKSSYQVYISKLIKQYKLEKNICFVGQLAEEEMKEMYLKCNVFVSASTIENSPNSVGEAMLLGVPIVASNVGGVSSLFRHGEEGYLYPVDEPYMLAHYIGKILENSTIAIQLGENASKYAHVNYNHKRVIEKATQTFQLMLKE